MFSQGEEPSLFSVWSWTECTQSVLCCLNSFRGVMAVSILKAPGAYGINSRSHADVVDAYAPASALASDLCPKMGMSSNFQFLVRFSFSTGWCSFKAVCRHVVVTTDTSNMGLGRSVQWALSFRILDRARLRWHINIKAPAPPG